MAPPQSGPVETVQSFTVADTIAGEPLRTINAAVAATARAINRVFIPALRCRHVERSTLPDDRCGIRDVIAVVNAKRATEDTDDHRGHR
jgi:hypothetical protein